MLKNKQLMTLGIGNLLEFYDLGVYGFLIPVLSSLFYPKTNPLLSYIFSFCVFGIGFLARPLGGLFFGHIGDIKGRKYALSLSINLMAFSTFCISILPTYQQIGILAPILLTTLRILQGLCTGGEYNGSALFLIEQNDPKKSGLLSSILISFSIIGFLLSSISASIILLTSNVEIYWRVPFLIGSLIGYAGFYIRKYIPENHSIAPAKIHTSPFLEACKENRASILCVIGIGALTGTLSLSLIGYISSYLSIHSSFIFSDILYLINFCLFIYAFILPISGFFSDKIGHSNVLLIFSYLTLFFSIPAFYLMNSDNYYYTSLGCLLLTIIAGGYIGPIHAFMHKLFPYNQRYSGISFGFSLGLGLFGGFAPLISTMLIHYTGIKYSPAFYFMIISIFSIFCIKMSRKFIYAY